MPRCKTQTSKMDRKSGLQYELLYMQWKQSGSTIKEFAADRGLESESMRHQFRRIANEKHTPLLVVRK